MTPAIVLTALALSAFVAWRVGRFLHRKDGGMMPISLSSEFLNHAVYRRPWWELYEPIFRASINAEFTGRNEDEMEYKLDTAAIRKRFSEAVVVGWMTRIHILFPMINKRYFNIHNEDDWSEADIGACDWIIRPGDKCADRTGFYKYIYRGFSGDYEYPFSVTYGGISDTCSSIRPIPQITPEQKARLKQIEKIERDIESAQERLAELKQMDK